MGLEMILPFLRPIAHLIEDPDISEIMVNGSKRVFVERAGKVEEVPDIRVDERHLLVAVRNIARALGDDVSDEKPILDSRLPVGSRVAAVLPPCSVDGTTLTIRKFQERFFSLAELTRVGMLPREVLPLLRAAIHAGDNVLISGGTGTGKTTLLNALATLLPGGDRVVVIEDTAELHIASADLVRFEARSASLGVAEVTIRHLLRATLRHRPDRIIIGEVRGAEAFDLLQALNTGHSGSLSTIHAASAGHALTRLATCALQSGVEIPYAALKQQIADAFHLVVHVIRRGSRRTTGEVLRVRGYSIAEDRFDVESVFRCDGES